MITLSDPVYDLLNVNYHLGNARRIRSRDADRVIRNNIFVEREYAHGDALVIPEFQEVSIAGLGYVGRLKQNRLKKNEGEGEYLVLEGFEMSVGGIKCEKLGKDATSLGELVCFESSEREEGKKKTIHTTPHILGSHIMMFEIEDVDGSKDRLYIKREPKSPIYHLKRRY